MPVPAHLIDVHLEVGALDKPYSRESKPVVAASAGGAVVRDRKALSGLTDAAARMADVTSLSAVHDQH
jgi:hypothetical protein